MTNALDQIRDGGKRALARALTRIEAEPDAADTVALLDAAYAAPRAHTIGLTGPPGVGKSTLTAALIAEWRTAGRTVGVGELMQIAAERGRATRPSLKLGICGEHGGDPASVHFCALVGLDYVSCSPFRVPIARLAAAQAALSETGAAAHATD